MQKHEKCNTFKGDKFQRLFRSNPTLRYQWCYLRNAKVAKPPQIATNSPRSRTEHQQYTCFRVSKKTKKNKSLFTNIEPPSNSDFREKETTRDACAPSRRANYHWYSGPAPKPHSPKTSRQKRIWQHWYMCMKSGGNRKRASLHWYVGVPAAKRKTNRGLTKNATNAIKPSLFACLARENRGEPPCARKNSRFLAKKRAPLHRCIAPSPRSKGPPTNTYTYNLCLTLNRFESSNSRSPQGLRISWTLQW